MRTVFYSTIIAAVLLLQCSCTVSQKQCKSAEEQLLKTLPGYEHGLLYADNKWYTKKETIDFIWRKHANRCALLNIVNDKNADLKARYYAAEVLLGKQNPASIENEKQVLAAIYAEAIEKNAFGTLNDFGMYTAGDVGESGKHLVRLGTAAVPALAKLLDSEEYMHYWGSKDADVGGSWQYRAKDVAAFYIFQIRKEQHEWPQSPQERDKIISGLKAELKNEQK